MGVLVIRLEFFADGLQILRTVSRFCGQSPDFVDGLQILRTVSKFCGRSPDFADGLQILRIVSLDFSNGKQELYSNVFKLPNAFD